MAKLRIEALPKQIEFLQAQERETLYSGAFGAGKTRALCLKTVMRASRRGARELLCRKVNVSLKSSTLKTLLEPDGSLPPVLPPGHYEHNKSEQCIRLHGGGEILYCGLDNPDKIGSFNLSGVGADEAVELTEADWRMLRGRIRVQVDGVPNQIYAACNPGPPSHFLAQRFGLSPGGTCEDGCRVIQTATHENKFLPREYVADLNTFSGLAHKRYVLGQWVGSDGLVYDRWDRQVHVKPRSVDNETIIAVDDGYTNPFVALRIRIDNDGRLHIDREHYERKLLQSDKVAAVKSLCDGVGVTAVIADPSAAELIAELCDANLPAEAADNDVFGGIVRVQGLLEVQDDGKPRLTVDQSCENVVREFETYEWKDNDKPRKEFDHAMDAIRYGAAYAAQYANQDFEVVLI